jgi:hypothetical protein
VTDRAMTVRFHMVTVFSREADGRTSQCRTNEIENVGNNTCVVNDMRAALVRLVVRDGVSLQEARMALRAFSARLDDLLSSEAEAGVYVA